MITSTRRALLPEVELWIFAGNPLTARMAEKRREGARRKEANNLPFRSSRLLFAILAVKGAIEAKTARLRS